ncbi:glycerate kinase [Helcococcus kunzii]|uniref:glycerate kinase n=1 Tax=Helcococcus kunzii TaxID=40091 RepID=UPI0024AE4FD8|nr:glycerate kinase [Helcococcus kunzii]
MINNILIALDSFKGSVSSKDANSYLAEGIQGVNSQLNIDMVAIGDGGEGTLDSLIESLNGDIKIVEAVNSKGEKIDSKIGILGNTAIIESSDIIGLNRLIGEPNAYTDSSKGLGLVIKQALDLDFEEIIITLGGSAINDLGVGMLYALGVKFYNFNSVEFEPIGANSLSEIYSIDFSGIDKRIYHTQFSILSDVQNSLCGQKGATYIFGKQKGLLDRDFGKIDNEVFRVAKLMEKELDKTTIDKKMTGAAGGLGFTFMTVFNSTFYNGIEKTLEMIDIENKIKNSDLIITGEGSMDSQTYFGKAPIGISKLAKKYDKYCFAVTGNNDLVDYEYQDAFEYIFDLANGPISLENSIKNTGNLLKLQGKQVARIVNLINK